MELRIPSVEELVTMSPADVERIAHELEVLERQAKAASALLVQRVEDSAVYVLDGHKKVADWGRASNNWSGAETARRVKLARAMKKLPEFAASALAGELGVSQMDEVAKIAANPRVREHLDDADELFTASARDLPFDDLSTVLRNWEALADADGARQRHDRAVLDRKASLNVVGERMYLDAQGPAFDAVIFEQVLQRFTDLEWQAEWDILSAIHGDAMSPAKMERTQGQRRFDALHRIFGAAAGSKDAGPEITIDIVIDQATYEHHLQKALGGNPEPIPPSYAPNRRCQDPRGRVLDPRTVVAASALCHVRRVIYGADSVTLDMSRRKRLFTGPLREAVLLSAPRCTYIGCPIPGDRSQADHLVPWSRGGPTDAKNGGPGCYHHNPLKNNGTTTLRDAKGRWHTYRPDGTEIGWPIIRTNLQHIQSLAYALLP